MTSTILITLAVVSALIVIDVVGAFLLVKHNAKLRNKLKSMLSSFINVPSAPNVDTSMFVTTAQLESAAGQGQDVINQLQTRLGMMDNYVTKAQLAEASGGSEALMVQLTSQLSSTFVTRSQLEDAGRQGQVELEDLQGRINSISEALSTKIEEASGEGSDIIAQINGNLLELRAQLNKLSDGYAVLYNEVNEG